MTSPPDPLSDASIAAIRAHPTFRAACEAGARKALIFHDNLPEVLRWVTKDIGRFGIGVTAVVLQSIGDLTPQTLTNACLQMQTSSAGRVNQVVTRCLAAGEIASDAASHRRPTRRKLNLSPAFLSAFRRRAQVEIETAAALDPSVAPLVAKVEDPAGFLAYVATTAAFTTERRDLFGYDGAAPSDFFFQREAGGLILLHLLTAQPARRERLLQTADLSRNAISRRFGVSRAHVNKLLAEAERRGALTLPRPNAVSFSAALSDDLERRLAISVGLQQCAWAAMQAGV
jgi:hypothetical protein